MSWASRRRTSYLLGVLLFFAVVIGIPAALWLYEPPACFDSKQNQGETAIDKGGPCRILDERALIPHSTLWSRALLVRGGNYNAIAYIENPNKEAGVRAVSYHFGLYDRRNILIAERTGTTFIMPGGVTPVFEGSINTGNRPVAHTYFELTGIPVWERMTNAAACSLHQQQSHVVHRLGTATRRYGRKHLGRERHHSVIRGRSIRSCLRTRSPPRRPRSTVWHRGEKREIVFTWPDPFPTAVGRIDILPLLPPAPAPVILAP